MFNFALARDWLCLFGHPLLAVTVKLLLMVGLMFNFTLACDWLCLFGHPLLAVNDTFCH